MNEYLRAALIASPALAAFGLDMLTRPKPIDCSKKFYPARLVGGSRPASKIKWIVIHSTESTGAAANVASYFQSPDSGGSTQLVVGEDGCFRCVDDLKVPAGAPPLNETGLHIEFVGLAKWTPAQWSERRRTLALGTRALARWSREFNVPLVHVGKAGLLAGRPGVVTHDDVSRAFGKSDHTDPGAGFPLAQMLQNARLLV